MTPWLIDLFADRQLTRLFWMVTLLPVPVWLLAVFFPRHPLLRPFLSPWLFPAIFGGVCLYLLWMLLISNPPPAPPDLRVRSIRRFFVHPLVFVVLWAALQNLNLFAGLAITREAGRLRIHAPIEVLLCWIFAPVGILAFSARIALTQFRGSLLRRHRR
ncbi:MAG: DUF4281 domain-containing protein [Puniceicoccaceae bacterium]|nr:MAG: DUF4281 domain-containing protein [Puniceicoccaceae bacterium]